MNTLRNLRQAKGVSQQTVADALKITQQAYANYESGKREPDQKNLILLAEFFEVSVDYLIGATDDPTPPDSKQKITAPYLSLAKHFQDQKLPPEFIKKVVSLYTEFEEMNRDDKK